MAFLFYLCIKKEMPELLLLSVMLIPQIVAGIYAKSMGKNFWFWFFISFLIPIISLIILLFLDKDDKEERKGYKLADHVVKSGPERYRDELKELGSNDTPNSN
jgi:hypothetical protein